MIDQFKLFLPTSTIKHIVIIPNVHMNVQLFSRQLHKVKRFKILHQSAFVLYLFNALRPTLVLCTPT